MVATKRKSDERPVKPSTTSSRVTRSSTRSKGNETVSSSSVPNKKVKLSPNPKADQPKSKPKTIVIEHCKQCNQFKIRAIKVKNGLENGLSGITVLVNPEKPRRGCFEIREEGGETFISLLGMKRPFTPMKELDMDNVISDIISKIK